MGQAYLASAARCSPIEGNEGCLNYEVSIRRNCETSLPFAANWFVIYSMSKVARWRDLKHFKHITTTEFGDGQAFFDILRVGVLCSYHIINVDLSPPQCILPCIVQLLPANLPLIHCIRAYVWYCMMIGMHCMTEERLQWLQKMVSTYKKCCDVRMEFMESIYYWYVPHSKSPKSTERISISTNNMLQIILNVISSRRELLITSTPD